MTTLFKCPYQQTRVLNVSEIVNTSYFIHKETDILLNKISSIIDPFKNYTDCIGIFSELSNIIEYINFCIVFLNVASIMWSCYVSIEKG